MEGKRSARTGFTSSEKSNRFGEFAFTKLAQLKKKRTTTTMMMMMMMTMMMMLLMMI